MTTESRTMQLWPGGKQVSYYRDGQTICIRKGTSISTATPEEAREIEVEELAERLQEQEILCCDSCLVDDLLKEACNESGEFFREWTLENVTNLYPDPSDWDLEQCKEWLEDKGHDTDYSKPHIQIEYDTEYSGGNYDGQGEYAYIPLDDCEDWNDTQKVHEVFTKETGHEPIHIIHYSQSEHYTADGDDWDEDEETDKLRDAVRDNSEPEEIYEWYRVSKYLARKLSEIGEPVLDKAYGTWWGRGCTGQSLIMDGVLQRVAQNIMVDK